ncbi:MAG: hypothetical protein FJ088_12585 [Deltaproteobacteria bacterium]|nr:hypothetical protein [Deltaproteobacteria bacterium]
MGAAEILYRKIENPVRALKILEQMEGRRARLFRREIFVSLSEWERCIDTYREEEREAAGEEQKADILTEIGNIYSEKLRDAGKGIEHYEKALFHSPRHIRASMSLADKYVQMKKWEKAEPLLEMLLKRQDIVGDPEKAAELHYQVGLTAENLLDYDRAFREFQTAIKLFPENLKTSYGLARLYFKKEYYQLSKDNYIKILNSHKERMPDEDLVRARPSLFQEGVLPALQGQLHQDTEQSQGEDAR